MTDIPPASAAIARQGLRRNDDMRGIAKGELDQAWLRASRALANVERAMAASVEPAHQFVLQQPIPPARREG